MTLVQKNGFDESDAADLDLPADDEPARWAATAVTRRSDMNTQRGDALAAGARTGTTATSIHGRESRVSNR